MINDLSLNSFNVSLIVSISYTCKSYFNYTLSSNFIFLNYHLRAKFYIENLKYIFPVICFFLLFLVKKYSIKYYLLSLANIFLINSLLGFLNVFNPYKTVDRKTNPLI